MLLVLTGVHDTLIEAGLAAGRHLFTEKPVTLEIAWWHRLSAPAGSRSHTNRSANPHFVTKSSLPCADGKIPGRSASQRD